MGERRTLRDQAASELRRQILSAERLPGSRLIERDLAVEFNVSRIPLREALRMLAAEGLVLQVPGHGSLVSPFGPNDVRDLFDVRESLESLAARLAAERATPKTIRPLSAALAEAKDATAARDVERIARANATFHAEVVALADNALLTSIMRPLASRVAWLLRLTSIRDPAQQYVDHEVLFEFIAAGKAEEATAFAWGHIASGRDVSLALADSWSHDTEIDPAEVTRTRRRNKAGAQI